jgi:hypothetical protein
MTEGNVFRKEGETWTIVYERRKLHFPDSKGLQYIAYLLAHPGKTFHVLDLETAVQGVPPDAIGNIHDKMSEDQLTEHQLTIAGHGGGGEVVDQKAREQYKAKRTEIKQELAEAERNNDRAQIERLERDLKFFEQEILTAYGRQRNRHPNSHAQQARANIIKLIRKALKKIEKHNPSLHQHLRAIKTGTFCSYTPVPPNISWKF